MEKVEIDIDYDDLRFAIYKVEVGVIWLEEENHEDIDCYNQVYDKQFGYYDENVAFELDYNKAIGFANSYVENGVNGTYAIVSKIDFDSRYYKLDMEDTLYLVHTILGGSYIDEYVELFGNEELYHNLDNIIYSVRKQKDKDHPYYNGKGNGKIIKDFIQKCVVSNK